LTWIEGSVPTPEGDIKVYMDKSVIKVSASAHKGYLRFKSIVKPELKGMNINEI
jgi:alpha-L-rhamnosidase